MPGIKHMEIWLTWIWGWFPKMQCIKSSFRGSCTYSSLKALYTEKWSFCSSKSFRNFKKVIIPSGSALQSGTLLCYGFYLFSIAYWNDNLLKERIFYLVKETSSLAQPGRDVHLIRDCFPMFPNAFKSLCWAQVLGFCHLVFFPGLSKQERRGIIGKY